MGTMLKGEKDLVTLQIKGDGPIEGLLVTADSKGRVKGYPFNPNVDIPPKSPVKLDVGGAVGKGYLTVIKDLGLKEPYVGKTELVSGEIAEDLTYYYAKSEQSPSAVGLGVVVDVAYSVKAAGGFIISLMPGAEEETVCRIEEGLRRVKSVTDLVAGGTDAAGILQAVLGDAELEEVETLTPAYACPCSLERMERGLLSLGREELTELAEKPEGAELVCHFCNHSYQISQKRLRELAKQAKH